MRCAIAVVVLLGLTVASPALAVDPPGGRGWYQLAEDQTIIVAFEGGQLIITGGTPGLFVGMAANGQYLIRFERGVATARGGGQGREINSDLPNTDRDALTQPVAPTHLKAFVRQSFARTSSPSDGGRGRGGGASTLGPLGAIGGGAGSNPSVNVARDTTLVVDDTVNVVRRVTTSETPAPDARRGGPQVFPPSSSASGGVAGKPTRVIAREEHDAWLAKVLQLLGEDGARCETKGYGPGWISICEPRGAA